MASIEITLSDRKYQLSSEASEEHLKLVAEMVSKKIANLQKEKSSLNLQKAFIIAAFDFASHLIEGKKKGQEYRSAILTKAHQILERVQTELTSPPSVQ